MCKHVLTVDHSLQRFDSINHFFPDLCGCGVCISHRSYKRRVLQLHVKELLKKENLQACIQCLIFWLVSGKTKTPELRRSKKWVWQVQVVFISSFFCWYSPSPHLSKPRKSLPFTPISGTETDLPNSLRSFQKLLWRLLNNSDFMVFGSTRC